MRLTGAIVLAALACTAYSATTMTDVTCVWGECDKECDAGKRRCDRTNGKVWYHDCHVQDCTPFDGCGKADIVYVLDSSASIGDKNWWVLKQFGIDVMKGLVISPLESRVAAVTYSNDATTHWQLDEYPTEQGLEHVLWDLEWEAGLTYTADGLRHAMLVFEESAREDVKHIVIIVTDGVSNVKAHETQEVADEMHAAGIEVFTIGIGKIDEDECKGIASEPKDAHFHYVAGYEALVTITNAIINETCIAANRTECDPWSEWSDCVLDDEAVECGGGSRYRTRTCRFYLYEGAEPDIRVHTEYEDCDIECPDEPEPTEPPEEPEEPDEERCARCDFDSYGVGYLPVEENCHLFIQCVKLEDGSFLEYKKTCEELYWRQSILSCDWGKDVNATCVDGPVIPDEPDVDHPEICDKSPGATPPEYIWHVNGVDYVMRCAPGTVFDAELCECVHGSDGDDCIAEPMLHFVFNEHYNDISCNRAAGTPFGNMKLEDGAAYFDGSSRVEVGFLKNWFGENPTSSLTLTMWFRDRGHGNFEGLFSNGDCVDDASLRLSVEDRVALGQVIAGTKVEFGASDGDARTYPTDTWTFVALVYSGWDVKYYVNGRQAAQKSVSGDIANTQCAASIGFSGLNNAEHFFNGYIDDVRVYRRTLYDYDLQTLNNNGRA